MSHAEKSAYYQALKAAGVQFEKTYQQYTTDELREAFELLQAGIDETAPGEPQAEPGEPDETLPAFELPPELPVPAPPVRSAPVDEMAGVRQNTQPEDEPIRVDEQGRIWYQEEVAKPAFPKPRGRRVMRYMDTGTKKETVVAGQYVETFEIAGDAQRPAEIKITLPSYQVGIYKDKRFPFRIHVYQERRGFDLFEVQRFYGGPELVPQEIKRVYVENDLCYDIPTTVRAIQTEARQLQLSQMKGR